MDGRTHLAGWDANSTSVVWVPYPYDVGGYDVQRVSLLM